MEGSQGLVADTPDAGADPSHTGAPRLQRRALHVVPARDAGDDASRRSRSPVEEHADGATVPSRADVAIESNNMVVATLRSALGHGTGDTARPSDRPLQNNQPCENDEFKELVEKELGKKVNAKVAVALRKEAAELSKKISLLQNTSDMIEKISSDIE